MLTADCNLLLPANLNQFYRVVYIFYALFLLLTAKHSFSALIWTVIVLPFLL